MANFFEFDHHRIERTGINEVIFALDKSTYEINHILKTINNNPLLITKLEKSKFESLELKKLIDYDQTSLTGFFNYKKKKLIQNEISIVAAGTSDLNIATEAKRTLEFFGYEADEIYDVGVAGLWRIMKKLDLIKKTKLSIVVAGMDGALPTVLTGLISNPVIAVPTSTGYGVADNGNTALKSMLTSCSPGMSVVNIDNGFGAACAAIRILKL